MKISILPVQERAFLSVKDSRILAVEREPDMGNPELLRRHISEGEAHFGPLADRFQVHGGTGYLKPDSVSVIGVKDQPADVPLTDEESEVVA